MNSKHVHNKNEPFLESDTKNTFNRIYVSIRKAKKFVFYRKSRQKAVSKLRPSNTHNISNDRSQINRTPSQNSIKTKGEQNKFTNDLNLGTWMHSKSDTENHCKAVLELQNKIENSPQQADIIACTLTSAHHK